MTNLQWSSSVRQFLIVSLLLIWPQCGFGEPALCADTVRLLFSFHGADTLSQVGIFLNGIGDVNGDGMDDLAVSTNSPRGVYIFYGNAVGDTTPHQVLRGFFGPPRAFDMTGDGIKDFVASEIVNLQTTSLGTIYFFQGYSDSLASIPFDSLTGDNGFGGRFGLGLVNANSLGDLVTSKGETLLYFQDVLFDNQQADWSYSISDHSHRFSGRGFIDWNGDNMLDLYVGLTGEMDSSAFVYIFFGPNFAQVPDIIIEPPAGFDSLGGNLGASAFASDIVDLGDFNADSFDDLSIRYGYGTGAFVFYGGPMSDTTYDLFLGTAYDAGPVGDFNGDGFVDVATGVAFGPWGGVNMFLGGPSADAVADYCFTDQSLPPNFLDFVGENVAAAGDFDGDGTDDILFSARNFFNGWHGDAIVVAGSTDIVTDVINIERHRFIVSLHPNYPNPFNPSTTISFDLPRRALVTLSIVNILGQEVAILVDREMPAGSHSVEWDGRDASGEPVASGVYLCRLETEDGVLSRKMLLLK